MNDRKESSDQVDAASHRETKARQVNEGRHGKGMSITFVVGLLISVACVAYIILDGADDAVYAYTVDQATSKQDDLVGKKFRVRGDVVEGSINHVDGELNTEFDLIYADKAITVVYDKPLPDTFQAGIEVIAEGELVEKGRLEADNVIAKCPSRYESGGPDEGYSPEKAQNSSRSPATN